MPPTRTVGQLENARKLKLHTQHWVPPGETRAVLIFVHGLGEYSDRYKTAFEKFASKGIAVFAYDHVGHGLSQDIPGRGRANVNQFCDLINDGLLVIEHVRKNLYANASHPTFIMGHSMGGLVATHLVLKDQPSWESGGLILHSAAIDVEWNPILRIQAVFGTILSALLPNTPLVPAVRAEDMSRVPEVVKAREQDEMLYKGNVKCRIANEVLQGFGSLKNKYKTISIPLLALHGTSDKCTSMPAVKRLVEAAGSSDKTFTPMEGVFHEMLFEPEKDQVVQIISDWVLEHANKGKARL